jgi:SAM-dependent methyltransferase
VTEPTGERFIPEAWGAEIIAAEHHARYRLAAQAAGGRTVLDAGCGVGWGTTLLLDAGALAAVGVDIADEAVVDAQRRAPQASFVRGDLRSLPLGDDTFDLVVCFEAIEHIEEPRRGLDELARVLAPGGTLLVSSPNPHVYPAGNPYHVHEFTPDELADELSERFATVAPWHQYGLFASVVSPGDQWVAGDLIPLVGGTVVEPAGHDPYSVMVATDGPSVHLTGVAMFALPDRLAPLVEPSSHHLPGHGPAGEQEALARARAELERERDALALDRVQIDRGRLAQRERDHLAAQLLEAEQRIAALIGVASANAATIRDLEAAIADLRASTRGRAAAMLRAVTGTRRDR